MTSRKLAQTIAQLASDKKAEDIVVLDMRQIVNFCDFFVICSGNTDRQVRAITGYFDEKLSEWGYRVRHGRASRQGDWAVIDMGDVVAHVFQKQIREFYRLEYLWREAKPVVWDKKSLKRRSLSGTESSENR
ncbi:MAG: ribosome silencing factor [Candidatus Omnitrophota bacterium]|nr:ribosome silencing factor [Candidatus Omnitrophota bacterium]